MPFLLQAIGGACGATAVIAGAFGAHALSNKGWPEKAQKNWQTAAHYQLLHSAMIVLATRTTTAPHLSGWLFAAGNLLFSGSIYYLTARSVVNNNEKASLKKGKSKLGLITPLGGLVYVAGWLALAFGR